MLDQTIVIYCICDGVSKSLAYGMILSVTPDGDLIRGQTQQVKVRFCGS